MFILVCCTHLLQAQEQVKDIEVGMWVTLNPCKSGTKSYTYMDVYHKTRYLPSDKPQIDSVSGEGVFDYFFKPGDFDAKRLPCEYGNKKYKVAALHVFETRDEKNPNAQPEEKRVMILYTPEAFKVIWVEFDNAYEHGEITW